MTEESKTILEELKETLIAIDGDGNNADELEERFLKSCRSFWACNTIATFIINMSALLYEVATQYKGKEIDIDIIAALSGFDRNGIRDDRLKNSLSIFLREWLNHDMHRYDSNGGQWCFLPEMMDAWKEILRLDTSGESEAKT